MKPLFILLLFIPLLLSDARASDLLPEDMTAALPKQAEDLLEDIDISNVDGFSEGVSRILNHMGDCVEGVFRQRVRGVASILLVIVLCGLIDGFYLGTKGKSTPFLPMAGALSITLLTAGSLDSLIGMGAETIGELTLFSKALLPTLAAATAATGAITTATFQQVTTVFFVDLLLNLVDGLLLPMVYLYIGVLTAASCLPGYQLEAIAEGLKKILTWILTTSLLIFTVYLSVVRVISGAADGAAVKLTKSVISSVVPVVGGIIAEASETVLTGASLLKNTIGIFGMLGILAVCAYPFLQLGIQYLLYKVTAFLAASVGTPVLCKLINGLAGAFGLVLGMTGACALLLLVSILSSVAAVMP